jgi:hypothetical protein
VLDKGEWGASITLVPLRHIDSASRYESVCLLIECVDPNLDVVLYNYL